MRGGEEGGGGMGEIKGFFQGFCVFLKLTEKPWTKIAPDKSILNFDIRNKIISRPLESF